MTTVFQQQRKLSQNQRKLSKIQKLSTLVYNLEIISANVPIPENKILKKKEKAGDGISRRISKAQKYFKVWSIFTVPKKPKICAQWAPSAKMTFNIVAKHQKKLNREAFGVIKKLSKKYYLKN